MTSDISGQGNLGTIDRKNLRTDGSNFVDCLPIAGQLPHFGWMPLEPVCHSCCAPTEDMLRFDLDNENTTVRNYRERVRQCEALGEYALAESIRQILVQEQEHQIDLATALGESVPE